MPLATHADRSHLHGPDVTWMETIRTRAQSRALPLWAGRVLFGGYFIFSGLNHFLHLEPLAGALAGRDVAAPEVAVALTGLLILLGGLSIVSGQWPRVGALFIAVFLAGATPVMHDFWAQAEPRRTVELANFTRNLALFGGACLAMAVPEPWNRPPQRLAGRASRGRDPLGNADLRAGI